MYSCPGVLPSVANGRLFRLLPSGRCWVLSWSAILIARYRAGSSRVRSSLHGLAATFASAASHGGSAPRRAVCKAGLSSRADESGVGGNSLRAGGEGQFGHRKELPPRVGSTAAQLVRGFSIAHGPSSGSFPMQFISDYRTTPIISSRGSSLIGYLGHLCPASNNQSVQTSDPQAGSFPSLLFQASFSFRQNRIVLLCDKLQIRSRDSRHHTT
jgi:hypothetical protein